MSGLDFERDTGMDFPPKSGMIMGIVSSDGMWAREKFDVCSVQYWWASIDGFLPQSHRVTESRRDAQSGGLGKTMGVRDLTE